MKQNKAIKVKINIEKVYVTKVSGFLFSSQLGPV
jgi:hypothetical protein